MAQALIEALRQAGEGAFRAAIGVGVCAGVFSALALATKGRRAFADLRTMASELRITVGVAAINRLTVTPLMGIIVAYIAARLRAELVGDLPGPALWARIGDWPTLLAVVVIGDFVGYWRHRLQHTRALWPAHAVHHGDPRLCWFSQERMHPIDELGTAIDALVLGLLGFPFWALAANTVMRHYWGYFIHSDLPWTLGKAGWVLSSPAMHRWHHARDVEGAGWNFATVFSVFDRLFGTYHTPGPCTVPLGVTEELGKGPLNQLAHPFRTWAGAAAPQPTRTDPTIA
jgi:sterol desaturase/sphingolipid hydroxylase (fatty acid hydroxylase superfamily)